MRSHIDWRGKRVPARMLSPYRGWIVRYHIGWGGERKILYKMWKTLPSKCILKTVRRTVIRNGPKQTIFASSGLRLLQLVSVPDTGWCAKDVGPRREVDCEIPHRLEKGTSASKVAGP